MLKISTVDGSKQRKWVARTTGFVVRVFSASGWSDQIRARGSEGILTRSIPQSGTGDQTVRRLMDSSALRPAYSL